MPKIIWDNVGERLFETGVSKGVLYLPNGKGIPWNGLTSVTEKFNRTLVPVYYDGVKINDLVVAGDFSGTISAYTYPDELSNFEGLAEIHAGIFAADQISKTFNLSYQTKLGSDVDPNANDYKIHILYNVTAIPSDKNYTTVSNSAQASVFEWNITAVPEEIPGYSPTAHLVLNAKEMDQDLLASIELLLYGGATADALFPSFDKITEMILGYYKIEITDFGDGTWSAKDKSGAYIDVAPDGEITITDVDAVYLDADTYTITDTLF